MAMGAGDKGMIGRRGLLASAGALGLLALVPPSVSAASKYSADGPRRLLRLAAERASAKLSAPDGFWDSPVARFDLPELFVKGVAPLPPTEREQLQRRLNAAAGAGARRAGAVIRGATGQIKGSDAAGLIRGLPTSVTSHVRSAMGPRLINEMIPAIERALKAETDPVVLAAIASLKDVALRDVAQAVAIKAESAMWYEVGAEEAEIRKDPEATHDRGLIRAFGKDASSRS
jgi:hypothetical protein